MLNVKASYALILLAVLAPLATTGCTGQTSSPPVDEGEAGTLTVPLVSQTDGVYYYLNATFEVEAAGVTYDEWLLSTDDYNQKIDRLTWPLKPGNYEIKLLDGWSVDEWLEDGTRMPVEAVLGSHPVQEFRIRKGKATEVHFDFLRKLSDGQVAITFTFHKSMAFDGLFFENNVDGTTQPAYDFQLYFDCTMETSVDEKQGLAVRNWNYGPTAVEWIAQPHPALAGLRGTFTVGIPLGSMPGATVPGDFSGIHLKGTAFDVFHGEEEVTETWSWEASRSADVLVDAQGFPSLDGVTVKTASRRELVGLESGHDEVHTGQVDMSLITVGADLMGGGGY